MTPPSRAELEALAIDLDLGIAEEDLDAYRQVVTDRLRPLQRVSGTSIPQSAPRDYAYADRGPGYRPSEAEDPHNAWITRCRVEGAANGPLAGKTVGLKDNISLAGIELTNGSRAMEGYVPTADATVVRRLLDAGATIAGKNNMWSFSMGAPDYGPVWNPTAPAYSVSGSSSGTAAAVAAGDVDVGMGGDQGGSVRIPSSFAGLVGLKPTHGLVPYTGIFGADASIDHTGPLTRTVAEAALALEAVAGRDGLDPRQPHDLAVQDYTAALDADPSSLTVGVLEEGFAHENGDADVLSVVRDAIAALADVGVTVTDVSVPEHDLGATATLAIVGYGYRQTLANSGVTVGAGGWADTGGAASLHRTLASRSRDLAPSLKASALVSAYVRRTYGASAYGKAQNLAAAVRRRYDEALADVDALVMPTVPITPPEYGDERGLESLVGSESGSIVALNTLPFNATHHPALTVPTGTVEEAPVGTMLVAERFDEATLFTLGRAIERTGAA